MGCGAVYEPLFADTSSLWTSSSKSTLYWRRQNALEEVATGMGSFSAFIRPERLRGTRFSFPGRRSSRAQVCSVCTGLPHSAKSGTMGCTLPQGCELNHRQQNRGYFSAATIVALPLAETIDTKPHNFPVQKSIALAYAVLKNQIAVISVSELLHILLQQNPPPTLSTVYLRSEIFTSP